MPKLDGSVPLSLVEKPTLGSLVPFVLVEAEVPVDAAEVVLGLPDEQACQDQNDKRGDADEDPFHGEQALAGASGLLSKGARSHGKA